MAAGHTEFKALLTDNIEKNNLDILAQLQSVEKMLVSHIKKSETKNNVPKTINIKKKVTSVINTAKSNTLEINKLKDEILRLKSENVDMKKEIISLKNSLDKKEETLILTKIKNLGSMQMERMIAASVLAKLCAKYLEKSDIEICGSFPRRIFELPKFISNPTDDRYCNLIGHDIDIVLYSDDEDLSQSYCSDVILKFMEKIQNYISISTINPTLNPPIKLGIYNIVDVVNVTITKISETDPVGKAKLLNIPHFLIKAADSNKNMIVFDIMGWRPDADSWAIYDFDVNSICISEYGIDYMSGATDAKKYNFFDVINNIYNKESECLIDLQAFQNVLDITVTRKEKIKSLSQLGFFFLDRLKIIANGYTKIVSDKYNIPCYEIETKESCYITNCDPPYVNLIFECNHKLSIMAYIGELIKGGTESSERIKCPQCRGPFKIKFKSVKPTYISAPSIEPTIVYMKAEDGYTDEKKTLPAFISDDSLDYIKNLYTQVLQPPVQPSTQPSTSIVRRGVRYSSNILADS